MLSLNYHNPYGKPFFTVSSDELTSGASGTTWTYEYDPGGNILSKKRYAYTEAPDLSGLTPLENDAFSYADANWRDKLTGYNGSTITYDAIGNPLNDGTWEYTWVNGRQLASMRKMDGSLNASFVYNSEGLRVQKTVNGVVTKYILHGKNIVHLLRGNDELHFFYDASGSPAMVEWNNGTTTAKYAYVKNLQGDIIAIIDDAGAEVVKYTYDAWGTPVSTSGTMVGSLGVLQPFMYRGYVWDNEIKLYYLRNRLYAPDLQKFINADSIVVGKSKIHNLMHYCSNNPIIYVDTNGDNPFSNISNWLNHAWDDVSNWTSQAATNAWNWTSQAATNAWNWTSQAATDAWNFVVTNSKSIINSFEMAFSGVTTGVEVYSHIKNIPLPPKYEIVVWTVDISLWVCDMVKDLIGE